VSAAPVASKLKLSGEQLLEIYRFGFPHADPEALIIDRLDDERLVLRHSMRAEHLRPGATLSGPTLMAMADVGTWLYVMAHIGPVLQTVTTSLHMDFLRRPDTSDLLAEVELVKLGRRLAVAAVRLRSDGKPELVAHANVTYSIPAS